MTAARRVTDARREAGVAADDMTVPCRRRRWTQCGGRRPTANKQERRPSAGAGAADTADRPVEMDSFDTPTDEQMNSDSAEGSGGAATTMWSTDRVGPLDAEN